MPYKEKITLKCYASQTKNTNKTKKEGKNSTCVKGTGMVKEYWKIIYKENEEQKEEVVNTLEDFEERIHFIWYNVDGSAEAVSGSYNG